MDDVGKTPRELLENYNHLVQYWLRHTMWSPDEPYDDYIRDLDTMDDATLLTHYQNLKEIFIELIQHINGQDCYDMKFSRW